MDFQTLLGLPGHIQIIVVMGLLSYQFIYVGLKKEHSSTEQILLILALGSISDLIFIYSSRFFKENGIFPNYNEEFGILYAIILTVLYYIFLRKYGREFIIFIQKKFDISRENFNGMTWESLINERTYWEHISICSIDGTIYKSDLQRLPNHIHLPNGPIDTDVNGNIAIYETERKKPDGTTFRFPDEEVFSTDGVSHMTYIPREQIARVVLSRSRKKS